MPASILSPILSPVAVGVRGALLGAFTPATLFGAGEQGVWYDPSDTSTLFQDSAGTTPVTASGQPVGLMLDKSKGLVLGPEIAHGVLLDTFMNSGATVVGFTPGSRTTDWIAVTGGKSYRMTPNGTSTRSRWQWSNDGGTTVFYGNDNYGGAGDAKAGGVLRAPATATHVRIYFKSPDDTATDLTSRELPGNHATQPTAGSRPIYRRGDHRGVVNLLMWSEDFSNAVWTKSGGVTVTPNAVAAPGGSLTADKLVEGTTPSAAPLAFQVGTFPPDSQITASCRVKAAGRGFVRVQIAATNGNTYAATRFNLTTGAKVVTDSDGAFNGSTNVSSSIVTDGDGYYLCSVSCKGPPGIAAARVELRLVPDATTFSYTGDGTSGIYIWGAQLNLGPTALPYQRNDANLGGVATGASTDLHWLETDGVDDGMATGNIDFTGTDKVSVFAGLRKLSSTGSLSFLELSAVADSNPGSFFLRAPEGGGENYQALVRGATANTTLTPSSLPAPDSATISLAFNLGTNAQQFRRNGITVATSSGPLGGGNFGNYPLYLFRRGGVSLPFNGWFYGLAITGRLTTDAETVATERFLAAKSAVVIP